MYREARRGRLRIGGSVLTDPKHLPTMIGLIELAAYPILMVIGQMVVIGAWLGIKTAGGWMGWQTSRTAFNRFLLFNLVNILVAFALTHFVRYLPCP